MIIEDRTFCYNQTKEIDLLRKDSQNEIEQKNKAEKELKETVIKFEKSLKKIQIMSGLIPICANCKKIRDDKGYWNQLESYIEKHSEAVFSHGICPDCMKKLCPEYKEE